ncbi:hypothetical protein DL93DRAFT_2089603 [Clavulina sp. PMI_390]|nr:hypothetical protein DL93DRAFT_2089603 [Clavulina sp. PMI_390]
MPTATVQLAYYWLNIAGGFILLPIITLTTILSRRVKTQVVLINVYLIFSYESLLACLLFLTGKYSRVEDHVLVPRIRDGDPLCMVQAILYEPTPILLSGAALSVVLHVLILVRSIYRSSIGEPRVNPKYVIIVPYLPYLGVVIPSLIVVLKNPAVTSPHQMYCIVNKNFVSLLTSFIVVAMSLSSVMIQVWILIILKHEHVKVYARTSLDPSMVIRVLIFTLVQIAAVV